MFGPLFAFITLSAWSLSDLISKHALSKQTLWFVCFWGQLLGGLGTLILGLTLGEIHAIPTDSWPSIFFFSVLNVFGMFFFYKAIQSKGVALALPIVYSWSVPSVFLGLILLKQVPSILQWIGIGTVLIGIFLVSLDPKQKRWIDRGTVIAFISMLSWGTFYFLIVKPSELYGEWWLGSALKIGSALLTLPFLMHERTQIKTKGKSIFLAVGLIGLLDAVGLVSTSMGLQISSVGVITGIISTTPAVVALFGILLFKEKVDRQQALGIVTTVLGLFMLAL